MRVNFVDVVISIHLLAPGQCCILKEHYKEVYMVTNGLKRVRLGSPFIPVVRLRDGQEDGICPDQKVVLVDASAEITRKD